MYGKYLLSALFIALITSALSQEIDRIDPPHWFVGMENDTLDLLVKGSGFKGEVVVETDGVTLINSQMASNPNYLYISLLINDDALPQKFTIKIGKKKQVYELKKRSQDNKTHMGLSSADLIYLITPDRFANGDPKNDIIKGMNEVSLDRNEPYFRHGGDIQGIIDHLDYIQDLGITALWINPLLENNEPKTSYHGYAITDHYLIDPRFGTNKLYKEMIEECHKRDMKVILDVVYNHIGDQHYLFKDLPDSNFINWWPEYTSSNFRAPTLMDPYASEYDKNKMLKGWFDNHMPDLNQQNVRLSNYLIQNSIWWIEEFGIDAFRIDTYSYSDQKFMARVGKRIAHEYPSFFMFGETWVHGPQIQSWFVENNPQRKFSSNLQSVTDFQLAFAIHEALTEESGWAEGINKVYYVLAGDYQYMSPENLVTFVDNHDISRTFGLVGENLNKFKIAFGLLLTTRGIPQIYYGSEILMRSTEGHGEFREDFWGGWPKDTLDKFTEEGRNEEEEEAYQFIKKIANYRKNSSVLTQGELIHFVPEDGVYTFFRIYENERIMVVINLSDQDQRVQSSRYSEAIGNNTQFFNVINEETGFVNDLIIGPTQIMILELKK